MTKLRHDRTQWTKFGLFSCLLLASCSGSGSPAGAGAGAGAGGNGALAAAGAAGSGAGGSKANAGAGGALIGSGGSAGASGASGGAGGSSAGGSSGAGGAGTSGSGGAAGAACAFNVTRRAVGKGALAFSSGDTAYDAAYTKAVTVISQDVVNGVFNAGESWAQVWTRDTSYSIDLGAGLLQPVASKKTLLGLTEKDPNDGKGGTTDVWIQDAAGHFGGWPNLSDSIVGAQGAWSLYLTTGDADLLAWSYQVTLNSLARAEREVFIASAGLFGGCSSFMESNSGYPKKYAFTKTLLAKTKALSTNLLYYRAYVVAAEMGKILGKDVTSLTSKAAKLKDAINQHLWLADAGYYAYFEDENGVPLPKMEGTGESFAILWGVADQTKTQSILEKTPTTDWGIPCLWPQFPEWMTYSGGTANYYHNGMVWPFVQGYWGWASAAGGSSARFQTELERMRVLTEKNDTINEFYRPEDGAPDGSRRQLWSASGYLSMAYHGLIGMAFDPTGVTFVPTVPAKFSQITLDGVPYRGMTLNVSVSHPGTKIAAFFLDGVVQNEPKLPATLKGAHAVDIVMTSCGD